MRSEVKTSIGKILNWNSGQQYHYYIMFVNKIGNSQEMARSEIPYSKHHPMGLSMKKFASPVSLYGLSSILLPTASLHHGSFHHGYHLKFCFRTELYSLQILFSQPCGWVLPSTSELLHIATHQD